MVKHVVMWKFKEAASAEDRLAMKRKLEALQGVVPSLLRIEVGLDQSDKAASMDMLLYSEFQTFEDLTAYAEHPQHLKVVEFVKPLVSERAVVDYEV